MSTKDPRFYIQVDVGFWRHPKAIAAGPNGRHLYLCALAWAREQLTDGGIPANLLPLFGFHVGLGTDETQDAADKLVETGLWERTANGWQIHDYAEHQQTREEIDQKRERWRKIKAAQRSDQDKQTRPRSVRADTSGSPTRVRVPESESESESEEKKTFKSPGPLNRTALSTGDRTTPNGAQQPTTDQRIDLAFTAWLEHQATTGPQAIPTTDQRRIAGYTQAARRTIDQHWPALKQLAKQHPTATPDQLAKLYRKPANK